MRLIACQRSRIFRRVSLPAALFLLAGLAFVLFGSIPAQAGPTFPDVGKGHVACDAIDYIAGAGIVSGFTDGTFGPEKNLTRGQVTKILVLWREIPLGSGGPNFPDLDSVYKDYVRAAAAQGWISGYPDGRFRPYTNLTREQMAIVTVRAMGWDKDARSLGEARVAQILSAFSDCATISPSARPYAALAAERGLFNGSGGKFLPRGDITRGQFSLVVLRAELCLRSVIQQVRSCTDNPDKTRVVFDLSQAPGKVAAAVSADGRLTIDYEGGAIAGTLSQSVGGLEVKSVAACQQAYKPRTVRITLNLARYQNFRVMSLAPGDGKGHRLVVDVFRRSDGPDKDGPPLICIDPGHGGSAPGAIGVSGATEKAINLAISLCLEQALKDSGLGVTMTRRDDRDVGLRERGDIANAAQASLFVSVHNNAINNPDTSGTETFYEGIATNYDPESRRLAEAIQRKLIAALGSVNRGAKTWYGNTLAVLDASNMTGALTEVGFMTNAAEEAKLLTPDYQQKAARAIADGILEYLKWSTTVYTTE